MLRLVQAAFNLSNFQDGCLPAAFMVGLLVSCPIFVEFSKKIQPFKLVGVGLIVWFVSVLGCGFAWDFWSLLFCRTVVGVGEASFVILAAPFISAIQHCNENLQSVHSSCV
jgi:MFS transporter, Spinster family, sphingosine-1-phosphate transporter